MHNARNIHFWIYTKWEICSSTNICLWITTCGLLAGWLKYKIISAQYWQQSFVSLYDETWNPLTIFLAVVAHIRYRLCFVPIDPIEVHRKVRPTQPINSIVREESVLLTFFSQDTGHRLQIHLSLDQERWCGRFDKRV